MTRRPPISTRTHTLFPDTSLFRSLPFVRLSLALLFLTAWLAEMLNSQLVLAAFLAGLLLGQIVPRGSHRRERLEVIGYGFIVPFFFINVGLKFDIPALLGSPKTLWLVPGLVAVAFANKIIPSLLLVPIHGRRKAMAAGILLSARKLGRGAWGERVCQ